MGRFGCLLFSLAIIGIGVETLICSYVSSHSLGPYYKVVPVIPWLPSIPSLTYLVGAMFILYGAGLLFQRTLVVSSITLGALKKKACPVEDKHCPDEVGQTRNRRQPRNHWHNLMIGEVRADQCFYAYPNYRQRKEQATKSSPNTLRAHTRSAVSAHRPA